MNDEAKVFVTITQSFQPGVSQLTAAQAARIVGRDIRRASVREFAIGYFGGPYGAAVGGFNDGPLGTTYDGPGPVILLDDPKQSDDEQTAAWYGRGEKPEHEPLDWVRFELTETRKPAKPGLFVVQGEGRYQGLGFNGEAP